MTNIEKLPTISTKEFFAKETVQNKFKEILGKKAQGFVTSVLQITASNALLAQADPMSVFNSAVLAATLDLPLNNSLGFAYIIPYNQSTKDEKGVWTKKQVAQFQIGYKGFIQLAQRSGQFKTIAASPIYEGQLIESNPLTGYKFDFAITGKTVIGFAGYFKLINGFEKTMYMTVAEMQAHGLKFSKTYGKDGSLWTTDFIGMGNKTVIKLLLSKFAPLSIEMQQAVITDQAVINNEDATDITYIDNEEHEPIDKEAERIELMLKDCVKVEDVKHLQEKMPLVDIAFFNNRIAEIQNQSK